MNPEEQERPFIDSWSKSKETSSSACNMLILFIAIVVAMIGIYNSVETLIGSVSILILTAIVGGLCYLKIK